MRRREFCASVASGAFGAWLAPDELIRSLELATMWSNLDGQGQTWFHPRICRVPSAGGQYLFMTVQVIGGSDYYGPVHWSVSQDNGKTWSTPEPVPGMGRRQLDNGMEEGLCDTVPEYHARTGSVLLLAHNVYYRDGRLAQPGEERWPVYVTRTSGGRFGPPRKLEWSHPEASAMYTSGCSQRVTLPGGDILVPLSLGPRGRADRGVCTLRCSFDGQTLRAAGHGNTLRLSAGRGLLEPTLALHGGLFYMSVRAENGQGFVAQSKDGLQWDGMQPWRWDDGEPLALSSTQQRWLTHSEALFLVYTRRDSSNLNVMRWRAPLYLARVDPKRMCLIRASERIAIPLYGDGLTRGNEVEHLGNFHTTAVSAEESLISCGTVIPANYRGAVRMARVRWARPNRDASLT
ncbi:MAG: exo-alpha-sialidase [Candidatus Solibacter usitatus]|nr:exo-alpha-sialidase [Candidatus Solibacter usitatus]